MSFTRLSKQRVREVKDIFHPISSGVIYVGNDPDDHGFILSDQDILNIFDFYSFKQTSEYLEWLKYNQEH